MKHREAVNAKLRLIEHLHCRRTRIKRVVCCLLSFFPTASPSPVA